MPAANAALRGVPVRRIIAAIADAADRWSDADFPPRVRVTKAIETRLGYSTPVVEYALDAIFFSICREMIDATIIAELGSLDALDATVSRTPLPDARAHGVDRVLIVSSDTTIGVALPALVYALCAKSAVTVKDRSDDLIAAFVATLGEERPELATACDVRAWTGGDDDAATIAAAQTVVAFGGDDALYAIRNQCAVDATFVPFGHRASAGYLHAWAQRGDLNALGDRIARDALLYDGDGCLSLHLLFVERTPALPDILAAFTAAFDRAAVEFPIGPQPPGRAARAAQYVQHAAFRAATGSGAVYRAAAGEWSIVVDPARDELPPLAGRVLPVLLVERLDDARAYIETHALPLQAVGVADPASVDGDAFAAAFGPVRIALLGEMQRPPFGGHHGGRARIADFVRWIDRA